MFNSLKLKSSVRKSFYVYFSVILIVTVFVYYPSFFFYFTGLDINKYFLETQNSNGWELLTKYLSYTSVSKYSKGDTLSFRPLFFVVLGVEKYFFGTRYVLWQLANIILHLGVVLCLYRLLVRIRRNIFAWLLCFLFSIYTIFVRLIPWTHIGGFILYLVFILTALYYLYDYTSDEKRTRYGLFWAFLCMFFASLIYEIGLIFYLLFVAYLMIYNLRKSKLHNKKNFSYLIILVPVFIYLLAYFFDKFFRRDWVMDFERKKIFSLQSIFVSITLIPKIFFSWIKRGFFLDSTYQGGKFTSSLLSLRLRYALLISSFLYLCICLRASLSWIRKNWLFIVLIAMMMISHVAIICLGRGGTHGLTQGLIYLVGHMPHACYMFWAYLLIFIYLVIDFERLKNYNKKIRYFGTIGLSIFILFNAGMSYRINRNFEDMHRPIRLYMDKVYQFVRSHYKEDDFSFAVVSPPPHVATMPEGYVDPQGKIVNGIVKYIPFAEVYFGEYYNRENPKYLLQYDPKDNKLELKN